MLVIVIVTSFAFYKFGYFNYIKTSLEKEISFQQNSIAENIESSRIVKQPKNTAPVANESSRLSVNDVGLNLVIITKKLLDDKDFGTELNKLLKLNLSHDALEKLQTLKIYNDEYLSYESPKNIIIFPDGWVKELLANLIIVQYNPRNSSKFKKLKRNALDITLELQNEVLKVNNLQSK